MRACSVVQRMGLYVCACQFVFVLCECCHARCTRVSPCIFLPCFTVCFAPGLRLSKNLYLNILLRVFRAVLYTLFAPCPFTMVHTANPVTVHYAKLHGVLCTVLYTFVDTRVGQVARGAATAQVVCAESQHGGGEQLPHRRAGASRFGVCGLVMPSVTW